MKRLILLVISYVCNIALLCVCAEVKTLPEWGANCLAILVMVWFLLNAGYLGLWLATDGGKEGFFGVMRSWRIERSEKKKKSVLSGATEAGKGSKLTPAARKVLAEAALEHSSPADAGLEDTPEAAQALAWKNWETICTYFHAYGYQLLQDMEIRLFVEDILWKAILTHLSSKYKAHTSDLSIYFIVKKGRPGFRYTYERSGFLNRNRMFFPEEDGTSDPELLVLLVQCAVDEWTSIKRKLDVPGRLMHKFCSFSDPNKPLMEEE